MSGGKGGSKTTEAQLPQWQEDLAKYNIGKGQTAADIGYLPWSGPDVAAFNPQQEQAMQNNVSSAQAFGLAPEGMDAMAGMPEAQEFAGGVKGYSSMPMFTEGVNNLYDIAPGSMEKYEELFPSQMDPRLGEQGMFFDPNNQGHTDAQAELDEKLLTDPNATNQQFPPGMEWLQQFMQGGGNQGGQWQGSGFGGYSPGGQRNNYSQPQGGGGLPSWMFDRS